MKKVFIVIISGMFSISVSAQEKDDLNPSLMKRGTTHEYYMMKDKKVWHYVDSLANELKEDAVLSNGVIITTKGEIIFKDGKRKSLSDGQCIDLAANVSTCEDVRPTQKEDFVKKPGY